MLYNFQYFEAKKYGDATISKMSQIKQRQFSSSVSAFSVIKVGVDEVEDETSFINLG